MNIPASMVSTIRITQTRSELKTRLGLSRLKTPADKKIKKYIGNKYLTKHFFSNKFREIQEKSIHK